MQLPVVLCIPAAVAYTERFEPYEGEEEEEEV